MIVFLSLLVASCFVGIQAESCMSKPPVPFTLYYESLCPFSEKFIVNELVPAYNDNNVIYTSLMENMTLIPYGHVYNPNFTHYEYTCQHGVPECQGNKLHGCAIKYIQNKRILLNYLSCLMNTTLQAERPVKSYPVNECRNFLPYDKTQLITNCYNSNEGWDLFNEYGRITDSFFGLNRFGVPFVSFNNMNNQDVSSTIKKNFRKGLCKQNDVKNCNC